MPAKTLEMYRNKSEVGQNLSQNKELELKRNREAYQKEMAQRRAVVDSVDSIMNIERIEHQKQLAEWEKQLAKWGKESEERVKDLIR